MSSKPLEILPKPIVVDRAGLPRWINGAAALVGILCLWPILLGLALAVRFSSPGPILFRAKRVGQHGRLFSLYKFRTMLADADKHGPAITTANDQRITTLGRWLRSSKLDELPQLFNILKGDLAWVGPRPEDPHYVTHFTPDQQQILAVLPGLTSPASLTYRAEATLLTGPNWEDTYLTVIQPDKIRIDLEYLRQRTLGSDLKIIWQTAWAVFIKH